MKRQEGEVERVQGQAQVSTTFTCRASFWKAEVRVYGQVSVG